MSQIEPPAPAFPVQRLCRRRSPRVTRPRLASATPKIITPSHHHTRISKGPARRPGRYNRPRQTPSLIHNVVPRRHATHLLQQPAITPPLEAPPPKMMSTNENVGLPRQPPLKHTARYTLSAHSRSDNEVTLILHVTCQNTLHVCHCGMLDEGSLGDRLDKQCGHPHRFIMSEGLASRLPGHRSHMAKLRRSDENSWLRAARQEREQDGQVSASTEWVCNAIRQRRAAAKKAVAVLSVKPSELIW